MPILLAAFQSGACSALLRVGIPCPITPSHDTGHELARGSLRSWLFVARHHRKLASQCQLGEAMSETLVASFSF